MPKIISRNPRHGWKPDLPDYRDLKYALVRNPHEQEVAVQPLPVKMDLRAGLPACWDQGQLGSCFPGDTKIPLLNGKEYTIKELAEGAAGDTFWVYSIDALGLIKPGKAKAVLTRKSASLIQVTLNKGEFRCTPDHQIMQRDGSYIEAQNLKPKDSLMPLYLHDDGLGYLIVQNPGEQKYHRVHWIVAQAEHSSVIDTIRNEGGSVVIHHSNFSKHDNAPENLVPMDWSDHSRLHSILGGFKNYNGTEHQREHSRQLMLELHQKLGREHFREISSSGGKIAWATTDPEKRDQLNKGLVLGRTPEVRKRAGRNLSLRFVTDPTLSEKRSQCSLKMWSQLRSEDRLQNIQATCAKTGSDSGRLKIIKYAHDLIDKGLDWTQSEIWNANRPAHNTPKFNRIKSYFTSSSDLQLLAESYNHSVTGVKTLQEKEDVYCLQVEGFHNFAISAGVFVHNCTSQGVAALMVFDEKLQAETYMMPSRLFIYYNERAMEGTVKQDSGAQIRDGIKSVAQYGFADEASWPYLIQKFAAKPPSAVYSSALKHKALTYMSVNNTNLTEAKSCLAAGFPFTFGFSVYDAFESDATAQTGILCLPKHGESNLGGHCVVAVGYDDTFKPSQWPAAGGFLVRNSWGTSWGLNGHFWMPYAYLTNADLASDAWTVRKIM
jgi:hypothetical protein